MKRVGALVLALIATIVAAQDKKPPEGSVPFALNWKVGERVIHRSRGDVTFVRTTRPVAGGEASKPSTIAYEVERTTEVSVLKEEPRSVFHLEARPLALKVEIDHDGESESFDSEKSDPGAAANPYIKDLARGLGLVARGRIDAKGTVALDWVGRFAPKAKEPARTEKTEDLAHATTLLDALRPSPPAYYEVGATWSTQERRPLEEGAIVLVQRDHTLARLEGFEGTVAARIDIAVKFSAPPPKKNGPAFEVVEQSGSGSTLFSIPRGRPVRAQAREKLVTRRVAGDLEIVEERSSRTTFEELAAPKEEKK